MSASEVLFQSNSVAALKEVEPDLAFIITKKEQPPLPPTFTASVTVRGQTFEAENTQAAGARARAAQLVLYYLMLNNDPALKHLNVSSADNEANPFTQFTEYPLKAFTLIKPGVKINIIRAVGNPPIQEFTARGNLMVFILFLKEIKILKIHYFLQLLLTGRRALKVLAPPKGQHRTKQLVMHSHLLSLTSWILIIFRNRRQLLLKIQFLV